MCFIDSSLQPSIEDIDNVCPTLQKVDTSNVSS